MVLIVLQLCCKSQFVFACHNNSLGGLDALKVGNCDGAHVSLLHFSNENMKPQEARLGVIKKVACLGSGFVGGMCKLRFAQRSQTHRDVGPTSAVMAFKSDARVTVVDVDAKRIAAWNSNSLPIFEPGLDMVVRAARDGMHICDEAKPTTIENLHRDGTTIQSQGHPNLFFSTDVDRAIEEADLIFICVNTPTKPRGFGKGSVPDLSFVEAATRNIARVARSDKIVVEKSTVPCKTAESIQETVNFPMTHRDL